MTKERVVLLGVGDVIIDREEPPTIFKHVATVLREADIAYGNCEQLLSDKGKPDPRQAVHSSPQNLAAFLDAGFDVVSLANNHALDWGTEALVDTMTRLKIANLPYCGVGNNIIEAHQPVILERKGTKVGFLAYSSVHREGYEATETRPGLAQVRAWTFYDKVDYQPATPPRIISVPHKEDLMAMIQDIKQLKAQVDVVVVCFHWGQHLLPRIIPMYCTELGHLAIDAGADLILGTHTHIIKGIEMYHGKAIFYSTTNFALELGKHMVDQKMIDSLQAHYRVKPEIEYRYAMIAKAIIEDGRITRVSYMPVCANNDAEPVIFKRNDPTGQSIFNYVKDISESEHLPVHFAWDEDEVLVIP